MIKFGTDGWRDIVGKDFNKENVKKVVFAIMNYTEKHFGKDKGIIIGYDCRNQAPEFARYSAEIFAKYGFNVFLSDKIVPTPVIAFSAKSQNACALMFTASHNPPEYLGIKFIPDFGGPATDDITSELTSFLDFSYSGFDDKREIILTSFEEKYIEHLETIIDFKKIANSEIFVNYDGLFGAASSLMTRLFEKNNIKYTAINLGREINFGGLMPDPKEKYLSKLKEMCLQNSNIGFSNDGDGDRFGVFDEKGEFVPAEDIIALLLIHLFENKGYKGKIAKTAGSGSKLDIVSKYLNLDIVLTPVGFKWLGKAMREEKVIIAGEESGGLSIFGHIPEKDGILAVFLILEALSFWNTTLHEMKHKLYKIYNREFYTDRIDLHFDTEKLMEEKLKMFENFDMAPKRNIKEKITIDGLKFIFDDDSWILVRKSGTEPLLRIYFEAKSSQILDDLKNNVKEFIQ